MYDWRLEQEAKMRKAKGKGMTDEQVIDFVNGCQYKIFPMFLAVKGSRFTDQTISIDYPAYELFTDRLRSGIFQNEKGKQLRLVVRKDRTVIDSVVI